MKLNKDMDSKSENSKQEKGDMLIVDLSLIPLTWSIEKWLAYAKLGVIVVDTSKTKDLDRHFIQPYTINCNMDKIVENLKLIDKQIDEFNKISALDFARYLMCKKIVSPKTGDYTPPEFQLMYGTLIKQGDELWKEFQDGRALVNNTINEK